MSNLELCVAIRRAPLDYPLFLDTQTTTELLPNLTTLKRTAGR